VIDLAVLLGGAMDVRLGRSSISTAGPSVAPRSAAFPRGTAHTWDRDRLSLETIAVLRVEGAAIAEHLITDVLRLDDAPDLLAEIANHRRHVLPAILTC
jgi:hypothetical protein